MIGGKIKWVEYTTKYLRSWRKLSSDIQQKARVKEAVFRVDPFDARLQAHKLHGALQDYWGYSVDQKYRVVFRFIDGTRALFFDIGDHSIYQ